jgi:hypothetical protein
LENEEETNTIQLSDGDFTPSPPDFNFEEADFESPFTSSSPTVSTASNT